MPKLKISQNTVAIENTSLLNVAGFPFITSGAVQRTEKAKARHYLSEQRPGNFVVEDAL